MTAKKERFIADGLPPEYVAPHEKMCEIEPSSRVGLSPQQRIGHDVPTEMNRDNVLLDDHGIRDPACWMSSTGESGLGPVPRRIPKRVAYDDSPACYLFPH